MIRIGRANRNRQSGGSLDTKAYSILVDYFTHQNAARFNAINGWTAGDLAVNVNGKGEVLITVNGDGRGWTPLTATPPTGQALDSHFNFTQNNEAMFIGGKALQFASIVTQGSVLVPTETVILLAATNCSAITLTNTAGIEVVTDYIGTDEQAPRKGSFDPNVSISYYHVDATVSERISRLGQRNTSQYASFHVGWRDEQNQWIIIGCPRNNFMQTGPNPGTRGNSTSGTLTGGGIALSKRAGAFVYQEIPN